ncbi:hypothetical protein BCS42_03790 [Crenothrix sp. D3]|nr:hypothetical protein BCS42_03790 [Crenothrix sp. D3]
MAIDRRPTQQDLSWFLDLYAQGKLNLNPPYQRKSVWMPKDKRFFLDTVLNNYPCPAIYLQKYTDEHYKTTYNVIDGKQRLTTVIEFYANKIRLPDDLGDVTLNNKKWSEIEDDKVKKNFLNYSFSVETLDSLDYTGWNTVFDRLNRNAKTLSHQELRHARFDGWLINRAEQEAENPFWKEIKISSTSKARRMKDVEFISILMLVILEGEIVGFPQGDLDILYARYNEISESDKTEETFFENESFDDLNDGNEQDDSQLKFDEKFVSYAIPQDDIDEFEKKLSDIKMFISDLNKSPSDILTINKIFGKKRTTHLYTLWTYLALIKIPDNIGEFKEKYEELFDIFEKLEKIDESAWQDIAIDETKRKIAMSYYANATGATTEKPQRQARLEALKQFLEV